MSVVVPSATDSAAAREAAEKCRAGAVAIGKARDELIEKHGKKAPVVHAFARIETTGFRIAKLYAQLADDIDAAQVAREEAGR